MLQKNEGSTCRWTTKDRRLHRYTKVSLKYALAQVHKGTQQNAWEGRPLTDTQVPVPTRHCWHKEKLTDVRGLAHVHNNSPDPPGDKKATRNTRYPRACGQQKTADRRPTSASSKHALAHAAGTNTAECKERRPLTDALVQALHKTLLVRRKVHIGVCTGTCA